MTHKIDLPQSTPRGRALMIKAGYSGSGIADIVYMGDVVNAAAKLAAQGANGIGVSPIMIGNSFAGNLTRIILNLSARTTGAAATRQT
jgi:hypothetical protein